MAPGRVSLALLVLSAGCYADASSVTANAAFNQHLRNLSACAQSQQGVEGDPASRLRERSLDWLTKVNLSITFTDSLYISYQSGSRASVETLMEFAFTWQDSQLLQEPLNCDDAWIPNLVLHNAGGRYANLLSQGPPGFSHLGGGFWSMILRAKIEVTEKWGCAQAPPARATHLCCSC